MRRAPYPNRQTAGERLADALAAAPITASLTSPLVLALPRGGVPIGAVLARRIPARLDVFVVRKIGAPGHREYAVGAIAQDGDPVLDERAVRSLGTARGRLDRVIDEERRELARRVRLYRGELPPLAVEDRDVVVVDDGLATGSTASAALEALRARRPRHLVLATPVASDTAIERVTGSCDAVVCPRVPRDFRGVGRWYADFDQIVDAEVLELLERHRAPTRPGSDHDVDHPPGDDDQLAR